MRFLIQVVGTALLCLLLQYFLPWWTMAIGAAVVGYLMDNKGYVSFLAGFVGVGLLWVGMAMIIDAGTQSILTTKVNLLLPVNAVVLTGVVGGLTGGLAGMTGSLMGKSFR